MWPPCGVAASGLGEFMTLATIPHPLDEGAPPIWASEWGEDQYGVFVGFTVGEVTHRMRWIRPGRFLMGSPETEQGRADWEGPQHEVTFTKGFWLGETPCTQDLWEAVMEENPSEYQSPLRPAEQVSWEDCKSFVEKLNARVPGLAIRLPTEAEWEYACRAGTETSTYAGELEILGERNGPLLDEIGWYGGNSGVDFDLENGWDSSGWKEKQFPHTKAGTRIVGQKQRNPWGLYDMLGNIWEWCEDHWDIGPYSGEARIDPPASTMGSIRVVRGGSWIDSARNVRAAYRYWLPPGGRYSSLGFRLAQDQE